MSNAPIKTEAAVALTGEMIKSFREQMGWSQDETATALGCSRRSLVAWEGGKHVPLYIGLAMSALTMGLRPFGCGPAKIEGEGEE